MLTESFIGYVGYTSDEHACCVSCADGVVM